MAPSTGACSQLCIIFFLQLIIFSSNSSPLQKRFCITAVFLPCFVIFIRPSQRKKESTWFWQVSGKLESTAVARNTKKNMGGVLFTADLSEWNLGATRTALNNSRANLLSSLCGNVLPSQRPPGYPAPLSRNQPLQGRCQGNIAQICLFPSFSLSPSHSCCGPHLARRSAYSSSENRRQSPPADESTRFPPSAWGGGAARWRLFLREQKVLLPV